MTGWINADERLPENNDWVLIWYIDKDGDCFPTVGKYIEYVSGSGQKYWYTDVDNNDSAYPPEKITHWMPIPEPPMMNNE